MSKNCPFNSTQECSSDCALFIAPEDLNEVVRNKLASLGLFDRENGICSYKHMAMCMGRNIYEGTYK